GVGDTENRVDQLFVGRADVELEKRGLHRIQSLEALFEEGGMELRQIDCHAGSFSSGVRPSSRAAVASTDADPCHSTVRPLPDRSRTNAVITCNAAVSTRCSEEISTVTGRGVSRSAASCSRSAVAPETVHSAGRLSVVDGGTG